MAVAGVVMAGIAVASTVSSLVGGKAEAKAARQAAEYNAAVAKTNAERAALARDDALARGDIEVAIRAQETQQLVGAQRAALAAKGLDPNTGSAGQLQTDAIGTGKLDELRIANNAAREALGFENQRLDFGFAAQAGQQAADDARSAGQIGQVQSLISGAGRFARGFSGNTAVPTAPLRGTFKAGHT